jgi:hypothetical protein
MCHSVIGEEYFGRLVKKFKKRIIRSRTNTRSYRRNLKQVKFLARNSSVFGIVIIIDEEKRDFFVKKIKKEETEEEEEEEELLWPTSYLKGATLGGAA